MKHAPVIVCALLLATAANAQPPAETQTLHVTQGLATYYRADKPFANVSVGNTQVMDARPLSDRALLVQGYKTGTTNIILFDKDYAPLRDITVVVDAQGSGFVTIHNKAKIASYTEYSCWNNGCQFLGENTVSEPAPLPRGYYSSTSTYNQGNPPPPVVPRDRE